MVQHKNSGGNFSQDLKANVHTGAPPPWLQANEHDQENVLLSGYALPTARKGKTGKLNPKRVGAGLAEKRRAEMEMEKKESEKEFEKNYKPQDEKSNKLPLEIKPYISKRMRVCSSKDEQSDIVVEQ
ncbi:hypothetical protein GUJ93_ZPchr0002g25156 [Zizania palustris]|uniref:Uncharacterized protein n=1 Tax=Zizania palustris TaxID=103762 RepID=A0A8J5SG50_ZIZPA|nr:hypothetical protein GUJ93_ZPchr0002g25156 [Zizania palustris]